MINAKTLVSYLHKYVHMCVCVCDYISAGGLQALLLSAFLLTPVVDRVLHYRSSQPLPSLSAMSQYPRHSQPHHALPPPPLHSPGVATALLWEWGAVKDSLSPSRSPFLGNRSAAATNWLWADMTQKCHRFQEKSTMCLFFCLKLDTAVDDCVKVQIGVYLCDSRNTKNDKARARWGQSACSTNKASRSSVCLFCTKWALHRAGSSVCYIFPSCLLYLNRRTAAARHPV